MKMNNIAYTAWCSFMMNSLPQFYLNYIVTVLSVVSLMLHVQTLDQLQLCYNGVYCFISLYLTEICQRGGETAWT